MSCMYVCITGQQIQRYLEAVEMYSQLGLRTLCLGCRDLEEDEYKEWSRNFQEASCSLDNREVHSNYSGLTSFC